MEVKQYRIKQGYAIVDIANDYYIHGQDNLWYVCFACGQFTLDNYQAMIKRVIKMWSDKIELIKIPSFDGLSTAYVRMRANSIEYATRITKMLDDAKLLNKYCLNIYFKKTVTVAILTRATHPSNEDVVYELLYGMSI